MATATAPVERTSTLPETMKAAAVDRFGSPSELMLHTLPVPTPGPTEVLIELHAAGVGVWDAWIRDGSWRPGGRVRFPLVPGTDGAGFVVAKGARVRRFRLDDRVYAFGLGGFYAEYVAVDVENVGHVPPHIKMIEAGAAATTGLTALQGIEDVLHVRQKETFFIFGATGAVGTLAVQFGKLRQANVLATATGPAATRLVRKLGADGVIDGRVGNAAKRLLALAPEGIDAALVLAHGDQLKRCLDLVHPGGRIAYPNGVQPEPSPRDQIRVTAYDAEVGWRRFKRLEHAATEAHLRVPIPAVYPLAEAAKAHARLEEGHIIGRIALRIRPQGKATRR